MPSLRRFQQFPSPGCALPAAAHLLLFAVCRNASVFNLGPQHFAVSFQLLNGLF